MSDLIKRLREQAVIEGTISKHQRGATIGLLREAAGALGSMEKELEGTGKMARIAVNEMQFELDCAQATVAKIKRIMDRHIEMLTQSDSFALDLLHERQKNIDLEATIEAAKELVDKWRNPKSDSREPSIDRFDCANMLEDLLNKEKDNV